MLNRFKILLKVGVGFAGCVAAIGAAQATALTAISNVQGDTSWQDIRGTSYTFADANHNGQLNVGETVTFTVDMHKTNWGIHDFDALKVWIDSTPLNPPSSTLYTNQFRWDFDRYVDNSNSSRFSYKPWTDGDQLFSFSYTFLTAGVFDLTASVMCSADLSALTGKSQSTLATNNDWSRWTQDFHSRPGWKQGETERYQLTVVQTPVPEPETYAMMMAGLGLMGFMVRRRKAKQS